MLGLVERCGSTLESVWSDLVTILHLIPIGYGWTKLGKPHKPNFLCSHGVSTE
uniref:Uncharacterized protein n=1 Tax=Anguilla anguilla TaxID=7936 RepID=A0A0E9WNR1_ANGAN